MDPINNNESLENLNKPDLNPVKDPINQKS